MKFLSIILAVTVFILAIKPGLELIPLPTVFEHSCCGEKCTMDTKDDNSTSQKPKGCCGENGCNSFQRCCSLVLFYLEIPYGDSQKPYFNRKSNFTYQSNYTLLFTTDFWQPPKFV